ncbi:MAG: NIF family HAD-type phosphatase [Pseudomonadota bacterium]
MSGKVLALDLEGTLVSNAVSCLPRPGLHAFLAWCFASFERVVLFTYVNPARARWVIQELAAHGEIPPETPARLEVFAWPYQELEFKDLGMIPGAAVEDCYLVDDNEGFVLPEQKHRWIEIAEWERPYPGADRELERVRRVLERRLARVRAGTES